MGMHVAAPHPNILHVKYSLSVARGYLQMVCLQGQAGSQDCSPQLAACCSADCRCCRGCHSASSGACVFEPSRHCPALLTAPVKDLHAVNYCGHSGEHIVLSQVAMSLQLPGVMIQGQTVLSRVATILHFLVPGSTGSRCYSSSSSGQLTA